MEMNKKIIVGNGIVVDLERMRLYCKEKEYPMQYTKISKLIEICKKNNIILPTQNVSEETPMYISCRSFMQRDIIKGRLYMDLILYNSSLLTFKSNMYNRSIGHVNDVAELEIHQVLNGKVLVVIENEKNSYWGIFKKDDYFEIPSGYFHCTYVLEDHTVVANFYANAFWESDIEKKPYTGEGNIYTVYKSVNPEEYSIYKKNQLLFYISENKCSISNNMSYQNMSKDLLWISSNYKLDKSIFELFYEMQ